MTVAVNLSAPDLLDISLPARVAQLLTKHNVTADALVLEITETTVMTDPVQAQETLHGLRELGVELAVDDYGTGHCSLAYLRRLPVQELKLDRSFVRDAATDAKDAAIVTSTVLLTRALGMRMVGEGVEDEAVALTGRPRQRDCDRGTGVQPARASTGARGFSPRLECAAGCETRRTRRLLGPSCRVGLVGS
jgi:EAL domain-containing protein (putative c-di-GMP-specific phosphodiesterase class I)